MLATQRNRVVRHTHGIVPTCPRRLFYRVCGQFFKTTLKSCLRGPANSDSPLRFGLVGNLLQSLTGFAASLISSQQGASVLKGRDTIQIPPLVL